MADFLQNITFALNITGPIMLVMALGAFLKARGFIDENFIEIGSKLVFNITLPVALFIVISGTSFAEATSVRMITVGVVGTLITFFLMEVYAALFTQGVENRGVVVQGAYRSNMGIIGLAFCVNAYGDQGLVSASLYLGFITILFNVLAVITLSRSLQENVAVVTLLKGIATNPLIIGIVLALPFSIYQWHIPEVMMNTGVYLAEMTLPLALFCTGGSLSFAALRLQPRNTFLATFGKVFIMPAIMFATAYVAGLRGIEMGIVTLLALAPTAAASYVMVRAMGGNAPLAANTIVLSTLGSVVVTSAVITILSALNLM